MKKIDENTKNQLRTVELNHYCDEDLYETVLRQSEFNSLNLGWLHFKQPGLTKTNPYVVIDIFVLDEFTIGFQQLYTDSIAVKIIGNKERTNGNKKGFQNLKKVEEVINRLQV